MMRSTTAALLLLLLPAAAAQQFSVMDMSWQMRDYTIFNIALRTANLVNALNATGPFTVFAPLDSGFEALVTSQNMTVDQVLTHANLADILLYHVLGVRVMSSQFQASQQEFVTLQGMKLVLAKAGTTLKVGPADKSGLVDVTNAGINCSNGVIYSLKNVLWPPSIVDVAVGNPKFTTLVAALTQANLVAMLGVQGPFTVFAPTDAAFAAFLTASNLTSQQLLARADLADILKYHVVSGRILSSQLQATQDVTTLQGTTVTVTKAGSAVKVGPTASVTTADIIGFNGVIHAIDGVLVPPPPSTSTPRPSTSAPLSATSATSTGAPKASDGVGLRSYLGGLAVAAILVAVTVPAGALFAA